MDKNVTDCECGICQGFGQLPTISYEEGVERARRDALVTELVRVRNAMNRTAREIRLRRRVSK